MLLLLLSCSFRPCPPYTAIRSFRAADSSSTSHTSREHPTPPLAYNRLVSVPYGGTSVSSCLPIDVTQQVLWFPFGLSMRRNKSLTSMPPPPPPCRRPPYAPPPFLHAAGRNSSLWASRSCQRRRRYGPPSPTTISWVRTIYGERSGIILSRELHRRCRTFSR